jgi:hypothetical protein
MESDLSGVGWERSNKKKLWMKIAEVCWRINLKIASKHSPEDQPNPF